MLGMYHAPYARTRETYQHHEGCYARSGQTDEKVYAVKRCSNTFVVSTI